MSQLLSSYAEAASAQNQEEERQHKKTNGELWLQRRIKIAGGKIFNSSDLKVKHLGNRNKRSK